MKQEMRNTMAEKILLVDDDSNILDGYRRSLSRDFFIETATQYGQRSLFGGGRGYANARYGRHSIS
jgi:ActR/RegA family two-component response regulator